MSEYQHHRMRADLYVGIAKGYERAGDTGRAQVWFERAQQANDRAFDVAGAASPSRAGLVDSWATHGMQGPAVQ